MKSAARVQILEKAVCVSLRVNAFEKDVNPSNPHFSYGEVVEHLSYG